MLYWKPGCGVHLHSHLSQHRGQLADPDFLGQALHATQRTVWAVL